MNNKTKKLAIILICVGLVLPTFSYAAYSPTVEIKANNSVSPVTISYNTSLKLTWNSTNATSCEASGDWSGTKNTSGSETINNITATKNYIITCTGSGGSTTAKMVVNLTNIPTFLKISKLVQNVSDSTSYLEVVPADPGEKVSFQIQVTVGNTGLQNLVVKDSLPNKVTYLGNLRIDGIPSSGDIISGLDIGDLAGNQLKIITFDGIIADTNQFGSGITTLINSVLVYNSLLANSDTAKIIINKATGGGPTDVSTGITNNLFYDSFFLPLVMTLLIIWIFKSRIIKFEEWLDLRKKEYQEYRARKLLNKIRTRELLKEFEHKT